MSKKEIRFIQIRNFFILGLVILFVMSCGKGREFKIYRTIDHLKEGDIIASPLKDLYQEFERREEKLERGWAEFNHLTESKEKIWGISTRFPVLAIYDDERPPGMSVFRDGKEIELLKDFEESHIGWKWVKCRKDIEVKKWVSLRWNFEKEIMLPRDRVMIEIVAGDPFPEGHLPRLKVELNDRVVGEIKVDKWRHYRIFTEVDIGSYTLKISSLESGKKRERVRLAKVNIRCLSDIILVSGPEQSPSLEAGYKAVYYKDPHTFLKKKPFTQIINDPHLNYCFSLFKYKHKKEFMLYDSGVKENPYSVKKKLIIGENSINAILAPPRSEFRSRLKIPSEGVLEFGYGILSEKGEVEVNDIGFKVFIETSKDRSLLFSKKLSFETGEEKRIFHHKVDLGQYEGRKVGLYFTTYLSSQAKERRRGNIECNVGYWYNPVVYQRKKEGIGEHVNVILISIDTLRADHLGCYGYERDTSPNIDRLAQDSVLFSNCFSHAPLTLPSHMSILTSLYTINHGVYVIGDKITPSTVTLSDILRENNYFSYAFTGGGMVSAAFGFSKGFDLYQENKTGPSEDTAEMLFQKTSQFITQKHKDKNFFLFLHTYQTHSPYKPPEEYQKYLGNNPKWRSKNIWDAVGKKKGWFKPLSDRERKNLIDLYDGEIRYTDECFVKPLMEKLKQLNLYDNTMIIFTSDHGEEFFDHKSWSHARALYNESIRVPLIIKFPHSKYKGKEIKNIVKSVDIMPTILENVGVDCSGYNFDGLNLVSLLKQKNNKKNISFSEVTYLSDEYRKRYHIPGKITVISDEYKLIINRRYTPEDIRFFEPPPPSLEPIELYNINDDFLERNNLQSTEIETVKKLLRKIDLYCQLGEKERKTERTTMDEKLKERLKSLGYLK